MIKVGGSQEVETGQVVDLGGTKERSTVGFSAAAVAGATGALGISGGQGWVQFGELGAAPALADHVLADHVLAGHVAAGHITGADQIAVNRPGRGRRAN